jgi:hypothetical protein
MFCRTGLSLNAAERLSSELRRVLDSLHSDDERKHAS